MGLHLSHIGSRDNEMNHKRIDWIPEVGSLDAFDKLLWELHDTLNWSWERIGLEIDAITSTVRGWRDGKRVPADYHQRQILDLHTKYIVNKESTKEQGRLVIWD